MKVPVQLVPALWGAAGGAILLAIVGFAWFGWVTGSTAENTAKTRADAAVVAALAPVCVARFKENTDAAKNLEALSKTDQWQKGSFVEKGGWATFAGSEKPNSDVARACAEALSTKS